MKFEAEEKTWTRLVSSASDMRVCQKPLLRLGDRIEQFKQERRNLPDLHRNLYDTSGKHPMMVYYALVCRVKFGSVTIAV